MGAESFAVVLRTARHATGLTLEELAEASGVSVRALSDMERGRALGPQRRTVVLIADALKLTGPPRAEFARRRRRAGPGAGLIPSGGPGIMRAMTGTPLAWYGSSFAYYDDEPAPVDPIQLARQERDRRRREFAPEWYGPEPGRGDHVGVVLGRFLPVHEGHRFLIGFAAAYTPDLAVFVRVGPDDPYSFAQREGWLRALFPDVRVIAIDDAAEFPPAPGQAAGDTFGQRWADRIRAHVRPSYVFASEPYGPGLAGRLFARFVPVDPARRLVPVSGTEVRADPWARPEFLPPPVRASLVRRVCVLGPESSGKTTLVHRLAEHYGTTYVDEYARLVLGGGGRDWQPADTTTIAKAQQVGEEQAAGRATRVLFTDTNLHGVGLWSERLFGEPPAWVRAAPDPTDLYLLTEPDLPYVGHPAYDEPEERAAFHARCVEALRGRNVAPIRGGHDERFARAVDAVDALLRD